jgi:hypothetical protein
MKARVTIHSFWSGKPVMVRTVTASSEQELQKLITTLSRTTDGNPVTYEVIPEQTFEDPNFIAPERWN